MAPPRRCASKLVAEFLINWHLEHGGSYSASYIANSRDQGRSPTRFLFTWGRAEPGTYRIEAEKHLTCDLLAGVANVECGIHGGGHEFPRQLVADFLARVAVDSPSLPRH